MRFLWISAFIACTETTDKISDTGWTRAKAHPPSNILVCVKRVKNGFFTRFRGKCYFSH